jgi:hypothetical protein
MGNDIFPIAPAPAGRAAAGSSGGGSAVPSLAPKGAGLTWAERDAFFAGAAHFADGGFDGLADAAVGLPA